MSARPRVSRSKGVRPRFIGEWTVTSTLKLASICASKRAKTGASGVEGPPVYRWTPLLGAEYVAQGEDRLPRNVVPRRHAGRYGFRAATGYFQADRFRSRNWTQGIPRLRTRQNQPKG